MLASESEISDLGVEDREAISRDLFGMEDKGNDEASQADMSMAKSSLDLELYNLPMSQAATYVEASVRCPRVVALESSHALFLKALDRLSDVEVGRNSTWWCLLSAGSWTDRRALSDRKLLCGWLNTGLCARTCLASKPFSH